MRDEFVRDFVFPMFRANAIYEGEYLLGTSIARPLIAKKTDGDSKRGRSRRGASRSYRQKRKRLQDLSLDICILTQNPYVIAPWREWELDSRESLLEFAEKHNIPIENKVGKSPYSMDANLLHISYEGKVLEDPWAEAEEDMWRWSVSSENAPDEASRYK